MPPTKLYHFTSFESAVKILASGKLRFGSFSNANDIAESKRVYYADERADEIEKVVEGYRYLSFSLDDKRLKGWERDNMWGYYSKGGNGVCIEFDKETLVKSFKRLYPQGHCKAVSYIRNYNNTLFCTNLEGESPDSFVRSNYKEIFFKKCSQWMNEKEYRLIHEGKVNEYLPISDCIEKVIFCMPKEEKPFETAEYKVLSSIVCPRIIFRYSYVLGNQKLQNVFGNEFPEIKELDV